MENFKPQKYRESHKTPMIPHKCQYHANLFL
jgi:hypothetical protein